MSRSRVHNERKYVRSVKLDDIYLTDPVDYAAAFRIHRKHVPVILMPYKKKFLIVDGNHRCSVAAKRGQKTIKAVVINGRFDKTAFYGDTAPWLELWFCGEITYGEFKEDVVHNASCEGWITPRQGYENAFHLV